MSQTLIKGLSVLEALAHSSEPRGLTELARSLEMNQSAVQRLLNALVKAGYAEQAEGSRKYQLNYALWELGMRSIQDNAARRLIRPTLRLGAHLTGMTCYFALAAVPFVTYFERVEGVRSLPHSAEIGRKVSMNASAAGQAILAYLPTESRATLTTNTADWTGHVKHVGVPLAEIEGIAKRVRQNRYAVSQGGLRKGRNSIAAPVWGNRPAPIGSIGLTAGEDELTPKLFETIGAKALELAEEASLSLGGSVFRNAAELQIEPNSE